MHRNIVSRVRNLFGAVAEHIPEHEGSKLLPDCLVETIITNLAVHGVQI
jgi:hypothetical protein